MCLCQRRPEPSLGPMAGKYKNGARWQPPTLPEAAGVAGGTQTWVGVGQLNWRVHDVWVGQNTRACRVITAVPVTPGRRVRRDAREGQRSC